MKTETLPYIIDIGVVLIVLYVVVQIPDLNVLWPQLLQAGLLAIGVYFLVESFGDILQRMRGDG